MKKQKAITGGILKKHGNLRFPTQKSRISMRWILHLYLIHPVNEFCWKYSHSSDILIHSDVILQESSEPEKMPLLFIASDNSDRLLIHYSILVKQHSISKEEYDFWNNIKQVNEAGDDIFGKQPYMVDGNIHNISNPDEKVLGYFQVYLRQGKKEEILLSVKSLV